MFQDEVAARLVAQGVGVDGATIFKGSRAKIPSLDEPNGEGPFITLREYSGTEALFIHSDLLPHVQRPRIQVTAVGSNYGLVRAKARAAYLALHVWNTSLSGVFYQQLKAIQEPEDFGRDNVGRVKIGFNIEAMKQRS